jgi:hypothetical protein
MQEHGQSLVLAFDTSGSDFVRGVEVGRLWEQLASDEPVVQQVHASNAEMLLRMAEATERPLRADILDDTWLLAHFDPPAWAVGRDCPTDDPYYGGC